VGEAIPGQDSARIATSVILEHLLNEAPGDTVTLAWLIGALRQRSFGLVMLLMALVALVPGGSTVIGVLLIFPAVQMILARESPSLPRFIASRRISTERIARVCRRAAACLRWVETFSKPRWQTPIQATKRVVGFVVLLLAPTLVWPFPFSQIIPALVIMLLALAYLEEDGVLLCVALAAALVSLAITGATVWAGIKVTDWLAPLFNL
jgi:hypothetical protein